MNRRRKPPPLRSEDREHDPLEELLARVAAQRRRDQTMTPAQREARAREQVVYGRQMIAQLAETVRARLAAGLYVPADTIPWLRSHGHVID